ncbi:MAG: hypothetical protein GY768_15375 [Planctomycetaceae bacterium]|nr:hypothetical protein [Planctomycetaceae bacterium]
MGFLSGSTTFQRYWITNDPTPALGTDHLEILEKAKIGSFKTSALDQPSVGFLAGSHLLDTQFALEKNVIVDAMHFGVRIDTNQIPAAIRNAWLQMELLPLAVDNPSGKPTKAQRQEAKEAVEALCETEAASGKFRRMQQIPILWDALNDSLYIGGTSPNANELTIDLLERSFGLELERVSSGALAKAYASDGDQLGELYKIGPATFHDDQSGGNIIWWNGMAENFDYLGNEFLLWLWWQWETESDTISLADESKVAGMFARTLTLNCPLGESGKETISAESPVALPEAELAIRSGKLPRKAGITLVRNGEQYEFALQAETFTVGSAKIKQIDDGTANDNTTEDRIQSIRDLTETLDLLFEVFFQRRVGKAWKNELKKMRQWLGTDGSAKSQKSAA